MGTTVPVAESMNTQVISASTTNMSEFRIESKYGALNNASYLDHLVDSHVGATNPMGIFAVRPGMFF